MHFPNLTGNDTFLIFSQFSTVSKFFYLILYVLNVLKKNLNRSIYRTGKPMVKINVKNSQKRVLTPQCNVDTLKRGEKVFELHKCILATTTIHYL